MDDTRALASFSLLDPAVQSRPEAFYAALHAEGAVYRMPENGAYVVGGYQELCAVLRDTRPFPAMSATITS